MTATELTTARRVWLAALDAVEEAKEVAVDAGIAYVAARAQADEATLAHHDGVHASDGLRDWYPDEMSPADARDDHGGVPT